MDVLSLHGGDFLVVLLHLEAKWQLELQVRVRSSCLFIFYTIVIFCA